MPSKKNRSSRSARRSSRRINILKRSPRGRKIFKEYELSPRRGKYPSRSFKKRRSASRRFRAYRSVGDSFKEKLKDLPTDLNFEIGIDVDDITQGLIKESIPEKKQQQVKPGESVEFTDREVVKLKINGKEWLNVFYVTPEEKVFHIFSEYVGKDQSFHSVRVVLGKKPLTRHHFIGIRSPRQLTSLTSGLIAEPGEPLDEGTLVSIVKEVRQNSFANVSRTMVAVTSGPVFNNLKRVKRRGLGPHHPTLLTDSLGKLGLDQTQEQILPEKFSVVKNERNVNSMYSALTHFLRYYSRNEVEAPLTIKEITNLRENMALAITKLTNKERGKYNFSNTIQYGVPANDDDLYLFSALTSCTIFVYFKSKRSWEVYTTDRERTLVLNDYGRNIVFLYKTDEDLWEALIPQGFQE